MAADDGDLVWAALRTVELATGTALWYTPGLAPLPIRWVLIRDPVGTFEPQALFATAPTATAMQIVTWFVLRWSEEVTFLATII